MAIALRYAARSNVGLGPKSRNEDSGYAGPHLLVLADGMGGHSAGDVASSMIVGELVPLDQENPVAEQAVPALEAALARANAKLSAAMADDSQLAGMGSTTIALLRTGNKIAMAHIGDSRAFLRRGDTFSQITRDHSYVQHLLDEGRITPEQAHHHPNRSVVTRVMTGSEEDVPDSSLREAKLGDRFLLCSDGLSDYVGADVIEEIVLGSDGPSQCADRLIEIALKASTRDNVTVIVADVVDAAELPPTEPVVVGAAAKRMPRGQRTRALPVTPAEKAAALSRAATGRDDEDDSAQAEPADAPPRSLQGKLIRRGLGTLIVASLLGGGGYAAYAWSQTQYYVAADNGNVAVYQGIPAHLGPISLSHVLERSDVLLTDLADPTASSVGDTISAADLADARSTVNRLRLAAQDCRTARLAGRECTSTGGMPVPTQTATPTTPEITDGTDGYGTGGIGGSGATGTPGVSVTTPGMGSAASTPVLPPIATTIYTPPPLVVSP